MTTGYFLIMMHIIKKDMKEKIGRSIRDIKNKIYKRCIKARGADDPAYVQALFKLRTYNAEAQAIISERFFEAKGKYPDLTSTKDIETMVKIGERGRFKKPLIK